MSWPEPALKLLIFACVLALAPCLSICPSSTNAGGSAVFSLAGNVPKTSIEIRHRPRRRRRSRETEKAKLEEPQKGDVQAARPGSPRPSPDVSEPEKPTETRIPPEPMGPPPPPATWTAAEVQAAQTDCDRRLSGLHIDFDRLDPIREGACGLPAPLRLNGFESERTPRLLFDPAPTASCKMAQALQRWVDEVVQPKAKAYLHATVVRIGPLSGYDCRSRYGDSAQRLSQHAYANALDVAEFVTAKGEHIAVADAWSAGDERAAFLRDIHDGACKIFGTALGPEANDAHKNHFHLDMTERRRPLCDFTPEQARLREANRKASAVAAKDVKSPVSADETPAPSKSDKPAPAASSQERSVRMRHRHHRRIRS